MRVLFIGGTGNISLECTRRALEEGMEVYHLNRGTRPGASPEGVVSLNADIRDEAAAARALGALTFDAAVDFIAYSPAHVEADLRLFAGRAAQYLFLSSASAYRKPPLHHVIDESTPLANPFWQYSRDKIACEELLRARGPGAEPAWTVVRPSHTYGVGWIPSPFGSSDFTIARRMLEGREVVVHGDGQSLWTLTHSRDFAVGLVGLLGNPAALGEAVQITGDEALTWDAIHRTIGNALGVEPRLVHIPSDFIAAVDPETGAKLLGDKAYSAVFDCSKLKRLVPAFATTVPFHRGVRESIEWYMAEPARRKVSPAIDAAMDRVLAAWGRATEALGR